MPDFTKKTYWVLWVLIPFCQIIIIIFYDNTDWNIYTTYYVISKLKMSLFIAIFFFISGAGYLIIEKYFKNSLRGKIHVVTTYMGVGVICLTLVFDWLITQVTYHKEFVEYENIDISIWMILLQLLGILFILCGFLIYFFNICLFIGSFLKVRVKR